MDYSLLFSVEKQGSKLNKSDRVKHGVKGLFKTSIQDED